MKYFLVLILAFFLFGNLSAQDYLEIVAKNACSCCAEVSDTSTVQAQTMQLGLCMIDAAMPYKKKFKKDFGLDLDRLDLVSEQMGSIVALQMMDICPDLLLSFYERLNTVEEPIVTTEQVDYYIVSGTVIGVESDFFVAFSLKEDSGKINKYYWLSYLDSDFNLIDEYKNLIGDSVVISYEYLELFDPRINEYHQYRIIKVIDLANFSE